MPSKNTLRPKTTDSILGSLKGLVFGSSTGQGFNIRI